MNEYKVEIIEDTDFDWSIAFYCFADDVEHAKEQALDAYPKGKVIEVIEIEEAA